MKSWAVETKLKAKTDFRDIDKICVLLLLPSLPLEEIRIHGRVASYILFHFG